MKRYLLIAVFILIPLIGMCQAKIYTKKNRMAGMDIKTTKIVLTGDAAFDEIFQNEVSSRWRLNAFEFCTAKEYEKLKTNNDLFFLSITEKGSVKFLTYSRGGKKNDSNGLKLPFEVVSVPIGLNPSTGTESVYLATFLDLLQNFAEDAAQSDANAYGSLSRYNKPRKGRPVFYDRSQADSLYQNYAPDAIVQIEIGKYIYNITTDTHELQKFSK